MFVTLIYLISIMSWGLVFIQLMKTILRNRKMSIKQPKLLVALAIASLSVFIESVYFGASSVFYFFGAEEMFQSTLDEENWFIIKFFIAISGVYLLFQLKDNKE